MSTLKQREAHYKKKAEQLRDLFYAQQAEIAKLREGFKNLACGFVTTESVKQSDQSATQLQLTAATRLAESKSFEFPKDKFYI